MQSSMSKAEPNCNEPDYPDLVKTENGCFEFRIGIKLSANDILATDTDSTKLTPISRQASKDYYSRIFQKFKTTHPER